jgi:hypothetical protein
MRSRRALTLALLSALVIGTAGLGPAPALAAGGNLAARVDGTVTDGGSFEGTLTLTGFARQGDRLVARGTLDGTFTDGAGKTLVEVADRAIELAVDASTLSASCELAKLVLTAGDVEASGVKAKVQPGEVEIGANAAPAQRLQGPLCDLAKAVSAADDLDAVAQRLDSVLAALE